MALGHCAEEGGEQESVVTEREAEAKGAIDGFSRRSLPPELSILEEGGCRYHYARKKPDVVHWKAKVWETRRGGVWPSVN